MQKVQNRAIEANSMLETLGWMTIKQRMIYNCCMLIYKILINEEPKYLFNHIISEEAMTNIITTLEMSFQLTFHIQEHMRLKIDKSDAFKLDFLIRESYSNR
ncbi:Protein of unknown function [Cotesia congregata]|uniref:Uncharacterized protein n=1 Tax=Cotesia congregata TaxID=51543 RepID=A0A8J2EN50_COTCN|nr:Protein of unknown function [Cotesia congregata]